VSEEGKAPTFTEDDVANAFVDAIDSEVVGEVGQSYHLRAYSWAGDEDENDGTWPFTVVRDGREFEVDIDVRVTELTPERKAKREADEKELLALLERFDAVKTRVGES